MPITLRYTLANALNVFELSALNQLLMNMQNNHENTISSLNWSISSTSVNLSFVYNNRCNVRASIKGAINKVLGKKRVR